MNVLFLYPRVPNNFWSMQDLVKIMGHKVSYPPLGLMTIAPLLPVTWNKRLIDVNVKMYTKKDLLWADLIFISAMNVQTPFVYPIIKDCKSLGKTIVAGGPLFTHEHEKFPEIDHFILNEGEITIPQFLKDLEEGIPKKIYKTDEFADVHNTPLPDWSLVNFNDYTSAIVQYSRGCPYLCDFCDVTTLFGRIPRTKTVDQMVNELDIIVKSGSPEVIFFADDNFIGNKVILKKELLPALIEWRKHNLSAPGFATQLTINLADDEELMNLLLEAGFRHVFIGIETPEEEGLLISNKKQNTRRNLSESLKILHKKGFIIGAGFIVGFDTDKPSVFDSQIEFIQNNPMIIVIMNILKAPPGTALYDRMKIENRLDERFNFSEFKSNFKPVMDAELLKNGFRRIASTVYSIENMTERTINTLKTFGGDAEINNKIKRRFKPRDIGTMFSVIWNLIITNKDRKYYLHIFRWTYKNKPEFFSLAFFAALVMFQYRIILVPYLLQELDY
jgi:radical SAM superfamily enzyme YgiQ (UPF0313 family)